MSKRIESILERFSEISSDKHNTGLPSKALDFTLDYCQRVSVSIGSDMTLSTNGYAAVFCFVKAYDYNQFEDLSYLRNLLRKAAARSRFRILPRTMKTVEVGDRGEPIVVSKRVERGMPEAPAREASKHLTKLHKSAGSPLRFGVKKRATGWFIISYIIDENWKPKNVRSIYAINPDGSIEYSSKGGPAKHTVREASLIVKRWNDEAKSEGSNFRYTILASSRWPKHLRKFKRYEIFDHSSTVPLSDFKH